MKRNPETGFPEFEESDGVRNFISIFNANRLLREEFEKWPKAYGTLHGTFSNIPTKSDTHQSRLMPPMPIVKETAEDVLRKLIQLTSNGGILEYKGSHAGLQTRLTDIVELAKRVLENK